jgi:hypothetical protein
MPERIAYKGQLAHRARLSTYYRDYYRDPIKRRVRYLRGALWQAIKGVGYPKEFEILLGCSRQELLRWLESKFQPNMTFLNYGTWHIDHKRPLSSFEDPTCSEAWHFTNLQPLWARESFLKGRKVSLD